jgi:hypothetical protein
VLAHSHTDRQPVMQAVARSPQAAVQTLSGSPYSENNEPVWHHMLWRVRSLATKTG